jgi:muramoyltetrapeptide carboxypeptidase
MDRSSHAELSVIRPVLAPGGRLRVVAPASGDCSREVLDRAERYFGGRGHAIEVDPRVFHQERYLAGSDSERAAAVNEAFADPGVAGILISRGGYGSIRTLDRLDYDLIRRNPKPLIGFSDTTALQLALLACAGLASYSGLVLGADFREPALHPITEATLWTALSGQPLVVPAPVAVRSGNVQGRLVGGCLSLIAALCGTPFLPRMDGVILLMEDVHEEPYRVDRMLTQLRLAGVFDAAAGLAVGTFERCEASDPADGTIADVLAELPRLHRGPIAAGIAHGHHEGRCVLPIGAHACLDAAGGRLTV